MATIALRFALFGAIAAASIGCGFDVPTVNSDSGSAGDSKSSSSDDAAPPCCGNCGTEQDVTVTYLRCIADAGGDVETSDASKAPCLPDCYEACANISSNYGSYMGCTNDSPGDAGSDVTATCKFIRLCGP